MEVGCYSRLDHPLSKKVDELPNTLKRLSIDWKSGPTPNTSYFRIPPPMYARVSELRMPVDLEDSCIVDAKRRLQDSSSALEGGAESSGMSSLTASAQQVGASTPR